MVFARGTMSARIWPIMLLLLLALPATASASTLSVAEGELRFVAGPGELNSVGFNLQPPFGYTLQDSGGAPMTQVAPCTPWALDGGLGTGGFCPPNGVQRIVASLGDDGDTWSTGVMGDVPAPTALWGGSGNDRLTGSRFGDVLVGDAGEDELTGGDGDDTIDVLDGERDVVHCGLGNDGVASDAEDVLDADCEGPAEPVTGLPPLTPQPPSGGQLPPRGQLPAGKKPSPEPFAAYASWRKALPLRRALRRGVPLAVECTQACDISARLTLPPRRKGGARRVVASASTATGAGELDLYARFDKQGRKLVRRYGAVALRLQLDVTPSAGGKGKAERFAGRVQLR